MGACWGGVGGGEGVGAVFRGDGELAYGLFFGGGEGEGGVGGGGGEEVVAVIRWGGFCGGGGSGVEDKSFGGFGLVG